MNLTLQTEYWNNHNARSAFKEFILNVHGLDFSEWESAGYWDDAYTPFSFFVGDKVIASVCLYLLNAIIDGRPTHVAQISGVGTLPEWRRKGLNRRLTNIALEWTQGKHEGIFLFSDEDAIPFYQRCGFTATEEYIAVAQALPVQHRSGAVKLDPGKQRERDKIYAYATQRAPISNRFSVLNAKLIMFHVLYVLRDHVYEIPDLACIVFYERRNGCVMIYDIVGERIPSMEELYPYIAAPEDKEIEFHFYPDKLGLEHTEAKLLTGNNLFVGQGFPITKPVFPFTSRA